MYIRKEIIMVKKIIAAIIALTLITAALASCSSDKNNDDVKTGTENNTAETTETTDNGKKDDDVPSSIVNLTDTLDVVIDKIYEKKPVELRLMTTPVDLEDKDALKAFTGLDSADKLKEAYASEPMMSSQAYSLVLMRLKDAADAESVAQEVKAGINPAKWICVSADTPRVVAYGDVVLMIMIDPNFADTVTSDEIVEAFGKVCGGDFSVDLK